jgi:hypothetical protein
MALPNLDEIHGVDVDSQAVTRVAPQYFIDELAERARADMPVIAGAVPGLATEPTPHAVGPAPQPTESPRRGVQIVIAATGVLVASVFAAWVVTATIVFLR